MYRNVRTKTMRDNQENFLSKFSEKGPGSGYQKFGTALARAASANKLPLPDNSVPIYLIQ